MKKLFYITLPKILIFLGWAILVFEWVYSKFDKTLGQDGITAAMILFIFGAAPVLFWVLDDKSKELSK